MCIERCTKIIAVNNSECCKPQPTPPPPKECPFQSPIPLCSQVPSAKLEAGPKSCITHYSFDTESSNFLVSEGEFIVRNHIAYQLTEFHLHIPGEHTIDGKEFAAEFHFVYKSTTDEIYVVAIPLVVDGKNQWISRILCGESFKVPAQGTQYAYCGSLTTPPFDIPVNWSVFRSQTVSSEQLGALQQYAKSARPLQELRGRGVFQSAHYSCCC